MYQFFLTSSEEVGFDPVSEEKILLVKEYPMYQGASNFISVRFRWLVANFLTFQLLFNTLLQLFEKWKISGTHVSWLPITMCILMHIYMQHISTIRLEWFYLQGLQIAFLWVTEEGGDAMIVPHTANVGVPPQWEDLTNDGHPPQRAMNQLHDVCITHLLKTKATQEDFSLRGLSLLSVVAFLIWLRFLCSEESWHKLWIWSFWRAVFWVEVEGFKKLWLFYKELKYQMTLLGQQSN